MFLEHLEDRRVLATYNAGLLHYWNFDEADSGVDPADDKIGANNGAFVGSAVRTGGLIGLGAAQFNDAVGDGVTVGTTGFSTAGGITIEAYIDSNWTGTGYDEIFRKEDGNNRILLSFQADGNNGFANPPVPAGPVLSFGLNVGGTYREFDLPLDGVAGRPTLAQMTDGTPDHVVATYDEATGAKSIFVNGLGHFVIEGGPVAVGSTATATIGNIGPGGNEAFKNLIDEVAIYDRALSAVEIVAHRNNLLAGFNYFYDGSFDADDVAPGTAGDGTPDSFTVRLNGGSIEVLANGVSIALLDAATATIDIEGSADNDTLTVDYSAGFFAANINFQGGSQTSAPGDLLRVIGGGTETATYRPSATTFGDGAIDVDGSLITFTGLEPVDLVGMLTANVIFPNGADDVTVEDGVTFGGGAAAAVVVSGTSGGVAFETVALRNNTNVVIDTVAGGVDAVDTVTLNTVGGTASGNTNLSIETGAGVVDMVVFTGTVSIAGTLAVSTQQINLNGGAAIQAADVTLDAGGGSIADGDPGMLDVTAGTLNVTAGAGGVDLDIVVTTLNSDTSSGNGNQTFSQLGGTAGILSLDAGSGTITLDQGDFNLLAADSIADASRVTVNTPGALNLNGFDETIASLAGNGTVDLGGNQLTIGGDNANVTFTGTLLGTAAATLNKVGSGEFNLNALTSVASYLGSWSVDGGALVIDAEGRLGPAPAAATADYLTLAGGGALRTQGAFGMNANRGITLGAGGGEIEVAPGGGLFVSGPFVGGTGLTKSGGGDLILQQNAVANDIGEIDLAAGRLFFQSQNSLGAGPINVASGATLDYQTGGALTLSNLITIASGGGVAARGGPLTLPATTVLPSAGLVIFNRDDQPTVSLILAGGVPLTADLTIQVGGGNPIVGAVEIQGDVTGAGGIIKTGEGRLTLSGTNTYSGGTQIDVGVLEGVGGAAIPDTSAVVLANLAGVAFDLIDEAETIGSLAGGGPVGGVVQLGAGTLTAGGDGASTTFSGAITGLGGNLIKVGGGTFTLETQDVVGNYDGLTTVDAGTLLVNTVIDSAVLVSAAGTLGGVGAVNAALTVNGGTVTPGPGPGALDAGDTTFTGGELVVEIGGATAGDGPGFHDQLNVAGSVNLGGATLTVVSSGGYTPVGGDAYVIVNNDGGDTIPDAFASFAEGDLLSADFLGSGLSAIITYQGGDGNDAAIVVVGDVEYTGDATDEAFELRRAGGFVQLLRGGVVVDSRPLAAVASFTVNGGDGNDSLFVNYAGGDLAFPIAFNGQGQSGAPGDSLQVGGGTATTVEHTFTSASDGEIDIDGRVISYTGLEPVTDNLVVANRIFTFTGAAEIVTLSDDGIAANEQSRIDSTLSEAVTFTNATASLTINLTSGVDTLNVEGIDLLEPGAALYSADLTITQDGGDAVSFQTAPTGIGAGALSVTAETIAFSATVSTTSDATLAAVGAITTADAGLDLVAGNLLLSAGTGADLDTTIATLDATISGAGNLQVDETDALDILNLNVAAGDAAVLAGGALTDGATATISVSGTANFGGSSIVLGEGAGDAADFGSLTFNSAGAVAITEDSATNLTGTSTAASLALVSAGGLTDDAGTSLTVGGNADLDATSIALGDSLGDTIHFGSLTFNATGAVAIDEDSGTELTGSNSAASLDLASAGALTDAAGTTLAITGNASLSGSSITLGDSLGDTTNFGSLTFNSAGAVVITEDSDTEIAGINTAGSLDLTSPLDITDAAGTSIDVTGNATLDGANITLGDSVGDTTNFGDLTFTATGAVAITEDSGMTLVGASSAAGPVTLTTADLLAAGQDLAVAAGATLTTSVGGIALNAGDGVTITGDISSATDLAIAVDAGAVDPGVGAVVTITGAIITATGATITGGADDDTFNLAPQATTSFDIDGGAPVLPTLPGDTLNLDLSGIAAGNTILTLGVVGSGSYSFAAPETEQAVTFASIETNNAIAGDYHLVLDMELAGFLNAADDTIDARLNGADLELRVNGPVFFTGAAAGIRSLTVIGSSDNETFTITETAAGLPSFLAAAPAVDNTGIGGGVSAGSHLNATADAVYTAETVADVTIHFVGGGGTNGVAFGFSAGHDVGYFSDTLGASESGNVGVQAVGGGAAETILSFVGAETLNLAGAGGSLVVDASSTPATSAITIDSPAAGVTSIVGDVGLVDTTFDAFTSLTVRGGSGAETIDLVAIAGPPLTDVTLSGSNLAGTDAAADTLRVRSLPAGVTATLLGGLGSDTFRLGNLADTVDNILGEVIVDGTDGNVAGQTDTLIVIDSGSAAGANVTISESQIDGLTGFVGVDVTYSNIDAIDITATSGDDAITSTFVAGSDLNTAVINGAAGEDQFFLSLPDADPIVGTPSGLTSVALNGNADNDTFGDAAGAKIQPSRTTTISINGGPPTLAGPPVGDSIGDVLNLDISLIPTTSPVIVSTVPGTVSASGYAGFSFVDIEDLNLFDLGGQTSVQMGDFYTRLTQFDDRITFVAEGTLAGPDRFRVTINNVVTYTSAPGRLFAYGLDGDDHLEIHDYNPRSVTFDGGDGVDYLAGGQGDDLLIGGLGADVVIGALGNDEIWGDNYPTALDPTPQDSAAGGFDRLSGGDGDDILYGGGAADQMQGDAGNDYLYGGQGDDLLSGDDGNDRLYGGLGNDVLGGGFGNDLLAGGIGDDTLLGKAGNDVLLGGFGADTLLGDTGNDLLVSGSAANEASNLAGDANDLALAVLLANWGTTGSDRTGLGVITQDGDVDYLLGESGNDDFSAEGIDLLADFNAAFMGTDEQF